MPEERDEAAGLLSGADAYLFEPARIADLSRAIARATALAVEQRLIRRLELAGVDLAERGAVL